MGLGRYERAFRLALKRVGKDVTVLRSSGSSPNGYGKNDGEWDNSTEVGTWTGFRSFGDRSNRPERVNTGSGERNDETPVIHLPAVAEVQNGDRLVYDGTEYEVTAKPVEYDTHYECRTIRVDKS